MSRSPIFAAIIEAALNECDDALAALAPDDMASLLTLIDGRFSRKTFKTSLTP